jgi:hypothetical protein
MSSESIAVDPAMFPRIHLYYSQERGDLEVIRNYVQTNCTLSDSFGLLLKILQPLYNDARDKSFGAMQTLSNTLNALGQQVDEYEREWAIEEANKQQILDNTPVDPGSTATATATSTAPVMPSSFGGGGGGGSFGGGGNTSTGSTTTGDGNTTHDDDATSTIDDNDTKTITGDDNDDTNVNVTNNGDGDVTVVINKDGTVTVTKPDGTVETQEVEDGSSTDTPIDPTLDPEEIAAQNAREAAFYEEFWKEQAAVDPLGRSADELRLAWENRDPITMNEDIMPTGIGYVSVDAVTPHPELFTVVPDGIVHSRPLIGMRL